MAWETDFSGTSPDGAEVEYQTLAREGWSTAERPDRVRVNGKVVHTGWASDHEGFKIYKRHLTVRIAHYVEHPRVWPNYIDRPER